jgi:hypothetical protein
MTRLETATARGRSRYLLLMMAAAAAAVVATTLSMTGLSFVNLDSLLGEADEFYLCLVVPAVLAVIALVLATVPRLAAFSLMVFVGVLLLAEAGAWALSGRAPVIHGEPEAIGGPTFYVPNATLGYSMAPSTMARHRRWVGETEIYDVIYRTDRWGRRATPTGSGTSHTASLLFFGDSNTFGEGLSQTETLPYYAGGLATGCRPLNYGVSGYGPAQLLALARLDRLQREIPERDGYAVYFFIPDHVGRVIGSSRVSTGWGRHFPYYDMNEHGDLLARGDFVHGRPLTTLAYYFWSRSNLMAALRIDLPLRYTAHHYSLAAKILAESRRLLADQIRLRGFVVVLGQAYNATQRHLIRGVRDALIREGVAYVDYTELFDMDDPRYRLSEFDYHNSARANHAIATRLVADLGLTR